MCIYLSPADWPFNDIYPLLFYFGHKGESVTDRHALKAVVMSKLLAYSPVPAALTLPSREYPGATHG